MRRTPALLVPLVALALGLAACGGNEESAPADPAPVEAAPAELAETDIVDTALAAGDFDTLAAALEAAGLVETLKGEGPFTVFAPTDEAFAALPEGTLDELLLPENQDQLTAILTYHVAEGEVASSALEDGQAVGTVQGEELPVAIDGETVTVGDATVTAADVTASNGVIHVIDAVLLPSG